jgi:hypothetical protein
MRPLRSLALAALLCTSCSPRSGAGRADVGYWNGSCLSGDGRHLVAGGDHAALVDPSTGAVVQRVPGMVKALGCDATGAIVMGYSAAFRLPGQAAAPAPSPGGETVLGRRPDGAWISTSRRISGGGWSGPAAVFVTHGQGGSRTELLPERFGSVGAARSLPLADSFAVRFGNLLQDGRLLLAAGWQPSRSGGAVEDVPWAFFAWDLQAGQAAPLTAPLASDPAINQAWFQRIAASGDGAHLVAAVHDGERVTIAWLGRGASRPARVTALPSKGAANVVAVSDDGAFVAIGTESRGRDAPAHAWLLDASGKLAWSQTFQKTVAGVHFLPDRALIVAAGEATAVRVPLPK